MPPLGFPCKAVEKILRSKTPLSSTRQDDALRHHSATHGRMMFWAGLRFACRLIFCHIGVLSSFSFHLPILKENIRKHYGKLYTVQQGFLGLKKDVRSLSNTRMFWTWQQHPLSGHCQWMTHCGPLSWVLAQLRHGAQIFGQMWFLRLCRESFQIGWVFQLVNLERRWWGPSLTSW